MFNSGLTQAQILFNVQTRLMNLRAALTVATQLEAWAQGVAVADLTGIGFSAADAASLLSAISDASALAQVYNTGQAPGTYPQVTGTPYVYAASQRQVIGPQ